MTKPPWYGSLRLSLVSCPVRLEAAGSESEQICLEPLNGRTGNPVFEQFVDAYTGDVVPADVVIRGYRKPDGSYLRLANTDLDALAGEADVIDVAHFCPAGQIDRARFDASYDLRPEGALAADTLASLRLAMQRAGVDAIAYLRLDGPERMALIAPCGAGLGLTTLRPPIVRPPEEVAEQPEAAVPPDLVETADGIIRRRMLDGDPNRLPDRYGERLRELIEQKLAAPATDESDHEAIAPPPEPAGKTLGAEVLLHIPDLGDRRFIEPGWTGEPGARRQIAALSIRPREDAPAGAIEYQVFARDGRATVWVSDGNYAGTQDPGLPLTGFAARPTAAWRDRLDVVYEGRFVNGGTVGPKMNGEPCLSPIADDPLEAVRVSIVARPGAAEGETPS